MAGRLRTWRNSVESFNAFLKDGNTHALEDGSRRRLRGSVAQYFLATLTLGPERRQLTSPTRQQEGRRQPARKRELTPTFVVSAVRTVVLREANSAITRKRREGRL